MLKKQAAKAACFLASDVFDGDLAEADVCIQADHALRLGIGLADDIQRSKGGAAVGLHPEPLGNQQGQLTKGAVCFDPAVLEHFLTAGKIYRQFTEGAADIAMLQQRKLNIVGVFAEGKAAIKTVGICCEGALGVFINGAYVFSVVHDLKFRLFGFAQGICQQAQAEDQDQNGENQFTGQIQLGDA